jgi:hypothetical protein
MIRAKVVFNNIPKIKAAVRPHVAEVVKASAQAIEQDVKGGPHSLYRAYPPSPTYDRTGNLGRSYHSRRIHELLWVVENDPQIAPYAVYVELGTRKMAARPHLLPSAEAERPHFVAEMREAVERACRQ